MRIREIRDVLLRMVAENAATPDSVTLPSPTAFLLTFLRFAAITVEDTRSAHSDGDGLLAQFGTHTFRGAREFSVNLTRQCVEGDDDDAPMWQLRCTFHWKPSAQTDALGAGDVWSSARP